MPPPFKLMVPGGRIPLFQGIYRHCTVPRRFNEWLRCVAGMNLSPRQQIQGDFSGAMMKAKWYYLQSRWLRQAKAIGPISETDLLHRIDSGKIDPTTMLKSTKTRDRWVPMSSVGPAFARWQESHLGPSEPAGGK